MQRLLYSESQEAFNKEKQAFARARAANVVAASPQPPKPTDTAVDMTDG